MPERTNSAENGRVCFLAVGDMHAGEMPNERLNAIFRRASLHSGIDFMTSVGDLANNGQPEQHDLVLHFQEGLPFPFLPVMGNHDTHTPERGGWSLFHAKYGLGENNHIRRFGPVTFVFLSPDGDCDGLTCDVKESLPLLEEALAEGEGPLFVFFHAPLYDTVGGAPGRKCFLSTDAGFYVPSTDAVRELFARANRPAVWVSGHTHTPVTSDTLVSTERPAGAEGAPLHHVNVGSPHYTGRDAGFGDTPLLYRFEVRWNAVQGGVVDVVLEGIPDGTVLRRERLVL